MMKQEILDRFLRYVKIDTQSDENSKEYPSTKKQFDLANLLVEELKSLGLKDVNIDNISPLGAPNIRIKMNISHFQGIQFFYVIGQVFFDDPFDFLIE